MREEVDVFVLSWTHGGLHVFLYIESPNQIYVELSPRLYAVYKHLFLSTNVTATFYETLCLLKSPAGVRDNDSPCAK